MGSGSGLLERLRADGAFLIGTWAKIPTFETVELLGHVGFDFAVVDMEHAPHGIQSAVHAVAHGQATGMAMIARAPDRSGGVIQRLLDGGIDGILVPRVETAAQAAEATAAMAFPPMGTRGMGYTSRASRWGLDSSEAYLAHGRDNILRGVQVEDVGALGAIEEILDVPALNALFIGFGDLCLSSGLPASHPTLRDLEARALAAARTRGIPVGTAVQTAEEAVRCRDAGYAYVMVSADTTIFAKAAKNVIDTSRAALGL